MLSLDLDRMTFEFKDGAIKHVGTSNKSGTAKLYDIEGVEIREFGDERVKLSFEDEDGSEVEVALGPGQARKVLRGLTVLEEESQVFE